MTRLAVGIDLVRVDEVQAAVATFGDRYLDRVFTAHERKCATGAPEIEARQLAGRFAAKEATIKALAPKEHLPAWTSIEVRQEPDGRCGLRLHGYAAELATKAHLSDFAVSLTHEGNLAAAIVFAIGEGGS